MKGRHLSYLGRRLLAQSRTAERETEARTEGEGFMTSKPDRSL